MKSRRKGRARKLSCKGSHLLGGGGKAADSEEGIDAQEVTIGRWWKQELPGEVEDLGNVRGDDKESKRAHGNRDLDLLPRCCQPEVKELLSQNPLVVNVFFRPAALLEKSAKAVGDFSHGLRFGQGKALVAGDEISI